MELLQGDAFDHLFRACQWTAFHLELQDSYHTPEESGPFDLWLRDEPDDFAWHQPWLNVVRESTSRGVAVTRARVVTEPHVDYTRWSLAVAPLNVQAGEDIRYLPRYLAQGMDLTTDDFWVFDDDLVVFTIFEPNGRWAGGAQTVDPVIVQHCRRARDQVWTRAIPVDEYAAR